MDFNGEQRADLFEQTRENHKDAAPLFSSEAVDGSEIRKIKLNDFRGKWVLLFFYPGNFTPV